VLHTDAKTLHLDAARHKRNRLTTWLKGAHLNTNKHSHLRDKAIEQMLIALTLT